MAFRDSGRVNAGNCAEEEFHAAHHVLRSIFTVGQGHLFYERLSFGCHFEPGKVVTTFYFSRLIFGGRDNHIPPWWLYFLAGPPPLPWFCVGAPSYPNFYFS